jgi:hypothetical protein
MKPLPEHPELPAEFVQSGERTVDTGRLRLHEFDGVDLQRSAKAPDGAISGM